MYKIKTLIDKLPAIGELVTLKDQMIYLFDGLGIEYNAFISAAQSQFNSLRVPLHSSLILIHDNISATHMAFHFLRKKLVCYELLLHFCPSKEQHGNAMTGSSNSMIN